MNVMNILHDSIVDGEGFRTVIFFAGCPHHCLGCHNPSSWDKGNGAERTVEEIVREVIQNELTQVTFSGGEPFLQSKELIQLAKTLKQHGKNLWCYTGFTYEVLQAHPIHREVLPYLDVLVDGRFELEQRDLSLLYKGSRNQRIIDIPQSLINKSVVLHPFNTPPEE